MQEYGVKHLDKYRRSKNTAMSMFPNPAGHARHKRVMDLETWKSLE